MGMDSLPEWSKGVDSSSTSASCAGSTPSAPRAATIYHNVPLVTMGPLGLAILEIQNRPGHAPPDQTGWGEGWWSTTRTIIYHYFYNYLQLFTTSHYGPIGPCDFGNSKSPRARAGLDRGSAADHYSCPARGRASAILPITFSALTTGGGRGPQGSWGCGGGRGPQEAGAGHILGMRRRARTTGGGRGGRRLKMHILQKMRMPGVEPGSQAWEPCLIPLHYMRLVKVLAVVAHR